MILASRISQPLCRRKIIGIVHSAAETNGSLLVD
jgi:hypothetical protein